MCTGGLNKGVHFFSIIQNSNIFGIFGRIWPKSLKKPKGDLQFWHLQQFRQSIEKAEIAEDAKIVDHILAFSEISAI